MKKLLKNHHRLAVCILLTASFLILSATVFRGAFFSIGSSATELWNSFLGYIRFIFTYQIPTNPINPPSGEINILPETSGELWSNLGAFFRLLFSWENFRGYVGGLEDFLLIIVSILPFLIIIIFAIRKYIKRIFTRHNNRYNKNSLPLKAFNCVSRRGYVPVRNYTVSFLTYIKQSRFPKIWLLIWLFNFNIFAILFSMIAILLYFFISFNFVALYHFFYNIVVLLAPAFRIIPLWMWLILVLYLIDRRRKRKALDRLRHMELMNKGFILERSICTMLVGTVGRGKTTLLTDMALSTEAIFRYKAYELMLEVDLMFPHFPYIVLENALKKQMDRGTVFNLASCKNWVDKLENCFNYNKNYNLFNYDYHRFGLTHNDKKTITNLFDALRDYCQLYFIYTINTSLIISNYAIRTDARKIDLGNLPFWDSDFFNRDARLMKHHSKYSHILDQDMLRLGKKLIENNKNSGAFEFGIIVCTEVGKERGNIFKSKEIQETIAELRKTIRELDKIKSGISALKANEAREELERLTTRATVLTDKFNDMLKLIRHPSTVANFPFVRVFLDEQRPESLGSDARDLCEIVHIREKSEVKLAMPLFFIGELLYSLIFPKFKNAYNSYRINRGDNTLIMHLLKKIGGGIYRYYTSIYNRFGFHIRHLAIEDAASGKIIKESPYYVSTKKIYSDRFSTDAYKDIFARRLKEVNVGIADMAEYASVKASVVELEQQNSYFINDLIKHN